MTQHKIYILKNEMLHPQRYELAVFLFYTVDDVFFPEILPVGSHGDDMALSIPPDCCWRLHSWQIVSDPQVHRGSIRPGVRSHCGGGLFLPPGGD